MNNKKINNNNTLKILVANGVNLDLLGSREPDLYGNENLSDLEKQLQTFLVDQQRYFNLQCELNFFQTNHEVHFLEEVSKGWDGALINPGAWTHTSLALADRLAGINLPFVEVHISNLSRREPFRMHSYCSPHAIGIISGFGLSSYKIGLVGILDYLHKKGTSTS